MNKERRNEKKKSKEKTEYFDKSPKLNLELGGRKERSGGKERRKSPSEASPTFFSYTLNYHQSTLL